MGAHVADRERRSGTPRWAEWQSGEAYTLGVEEEVMLLDPADWSLAQRIADVLAALPEGMRTYVGAETHASAVELHTDPHATVRESVAQLHRLRADLAGTLQRLGLAAAAAGTHPTAVWTEVEITPAERYDLIHRTMRELAGREPTYALHVHVGVPHPERAIDLQPPARAPPAAARAVGQLALLAGPRRRLRLHAHGRLPRLPAHGHAAPLPRLRRLGRGGRLADPRRRAA